MIYKIGTQTLSVPEVGPAERRRSPRQTVPWRDVAEAARCLDALCGQIPLQSLLSIVDGIAKVGFWGVVFRNRWPNCLLHLNDTDEACVKILRRNFPNDTITSNSPQGWAPDKCDLALLDADHFTLRLLDQWEDTLKKWSACCRFLIVADGACFGFKFGNLQHYKVNTPEEYYKLLDKALRKFLNKRITIISKFENAANILLEDKDGDDIQYLSPSHLYLSRGGHPVRVKGVPPPPKVGLWTGL